MLRIGDAYPFTDFRDDDIVSVMTDTATNLIGEQLKIDTMTPVVRFHVIYPEPLVDIESEPLVDANGVPLVGYGTVDLRRLEPGTRAVLYRTNEDESTVQAVYYVTNVERVAKDHYQINCESIIGRLDREYFMGRFIENEPFPAVINEILGPLISYQISPYLINRVIYGYIPNGTKRDALYRLMLAYGVGIYNDRGELLFRPVGQVGDVTYIPDDRIYIGGKVTYSSLPLAAKATAYYWDEPTTEEGYEYRVVFDNTDTLEPANNELIEVDYPYVDAIVETVELEKPLHTELDDNQWMRTHGAGSFIIYSGVGKLSLKCRPLRKIVFAAYAEGVIEADGVSVTDNELINPGNAQAVADRLLDYYRNGDIIDVDIVANNELCGNKYSINNPFGEPVTAAMFEMRTVYSGVNKASCKLVAGTDMSIDFPYKNFREYASSQIIDLSAIKATGATEIGILLVGGGKAGNSGEDGTDGEAEPTNADYINRGGRGGRGGDGGDGGLTKFITLDITNINSLTLVCGDGADDPEEEGGVTSISYTLNGETVTVDSADGESYRYGTCNPLSGKYYGAAGENGIRGGNGGNSGRIWAAKIIDGEFSHAVEDGDGVPAEISDTVSPEDGKKARDRTGLQIGSTEGGEASGGNYGGNLIMYEGSYGNTDIYYSFGGAGGGGSAYLANGYDGEAVYEKWR